MRSFKAFFKKEILESIRNGKIILFSVLFLGFGVMNPAIAKLTPWLMETLSESLAENGMVITGVTVNALTSWTQFFKNIPMALIVFVLALGNIFTKEYSSGSLVLVLTKGLARYKVLLSKCLMSVLLWTIGYWLCFIVTYAYNCYFWDNGIAIGLLPSSLNWWLFGVFTVCLMILFSVLFSNSSAVYIGVGGVIFAMYLIGFLPKVGRYIPTALMNSGKLLVGVESVSDYSISVTVTVALCIIFVSLSIPIFNKKNI